jgi:exosortase
MVPSAKNVRTHFLFAPIHWHAYSLGVGYLAACVLPSIFVWDLLHRLLALVLTDETHSHIPFVPVISACFILAERKTIFFRHSSGWAAGSAIVFLGMANLALARWNPYAWNSSIQISLLVLGLVLIWSGAFGIFFGEAALDAAYFPLMFLFFAVPIPNPPLSEINALLQRGSAEMVDIVFHIFRIPAARQGFNFTLPGLTIRVAEECSGIRSTLALVITAVVAGHIWLRSLPRTFLLSVAAVPISIAKNGVRIAVLTWLAVYVDPRFLLGSIHHQYGGMLFYGLGLLMIGIVLILLQRDRFQLRSSAAKTPSA